MSARPRGMWVWPNGVTSLSRITYELEEMKAKGLGGFDIWDVGLHIDPQENIPAGPRFMHGESIAAIGHAVREAKRLGLEMGLNVTNTFAGQKYGAIGLHRSSIDVVGPGSISQLIPFPEIRRRHKQFAPLLSLDSEGRPQPHREVAVLAVRSPEQTSSDGRSFIIRGDDVVDLSDRMTNDGTLTWDAPSGKWNITRYVAAPTGEAGLFIRPGARGRTPDFFSAEATEAHFGWYLEKLIAELGPLESTAMRYFFLESYELDDALWTFGLPDHFQERYGYDLVDWLPALDGRVVDDTDTTERFLFDFRRLLSDLAVENHFARGQAILRNHGMEYVAEAGGPGPPVHEVPFSDLAALGALGFTRGEFWNRHDAEDLQIVKGPASAAHLYNKPFVEAESFTSVQLWQESPRDLKPLADRAFAEGLNRIVYHVSAHTPWQSGQPGWVYPFGTLMYPGRAWWPKSKPWHQYLARVSHLLQQGRFVGDVLYYYGDQTPQFVKPKRLRPGLGFGYDYDVSNSDIILNHLVVSDGRLFLPHGQSYEILVLPDQRAANPEVLKKIEQLILDGATVIGPRPDRAHGLACHEQQDETVRVIADRLWGDVDGSTVVKRAYGKGQIVWGVTPREVLQSRDVGPDLSCESNAACDSIDYIHRATEDVDVYFIRNTSDAMLRTRVRFRVDNRIPEFWHPGTGGITQATVYSTSDRGVSMPLTLSPLQSLLVVFRQRSKAGHWTSVIPPITATGRASMECQNGAIVAWENGDYELRRGSREPLRVAVTELPEPKTLKSAWRVHFPHGWSVPQELRFETLVSWPEHELPAVRHFSGTAAYHQTFQIEQNQIDAGRRIRLDLGEVREIAEVWLNGKHHGILWRPPYIVDITDSVKPGKNFVEIEVANLLNNRLVGDAQQPNENRRTHSNITKLPTAWRTPWHAASLTPSGLLGPVRIWFGQLLPSRPPSARD